MTTPSRLSFESLELARHPRHRLLETLGRLRLEIFRDYPYLYEGTLEYEMEYLETYLRPRARIFLALDGMEVVGATTCIPMEDEEDAFKSPMIAAGLDPARILYLGESVLKREYRGQGAGVEFFNLRESYARTIPGVRQAMFCAVVRPDDHPMRPAGHQPLEPFWGKRGYRRVPGLTTEYAWRDVGAEGETSHRMAYWAKEL
jgi:hypothetical protein